MLIPIIVLVVLLIWVGNCLKVVKQNERAAMLRLGRLLHDYSNPLGPGVHWTWWPTDSLVRWRLFSNDVEIYGAEGEAGDDLGPNRQGLVKLSGRNWLATSSQEIPFGQTIRVVGNEDEKLCVEVGSHRKSKEEIRAAYEKLFGKSPGQP